MALILIACMASNGVIGDRGKIPWHLTTDLQRFKQKTMSKPVIMGRKTFESIGKALPGRLNIVLSRSLNLNHYKHLGNVLVLPDLDHVKCYTAVHSDVFVAGGQEIYEQCMAQADKIFLSVLPMPVEGDTYFPKIHSDVWKKSHVELIKDPYINYYYYEYVRIMY